MKHKKPQSDPALICVFVVAILCGIAEWVLTPKTVLGDKKANEMCIVSTIKQAPVEYLSNGDRVIYTKTDYFENEVQVWLASEAACKSVGLGDKCLEDLMAIAYTESRSFNYKAVGDGNKSYGAFQIHLGYHPYVTVEQATDPYWAAKWTINRLIAKGYLRDRDYAIMSHNGTPGIPATIAYLATVNKYINL